MTYSEWKEHAIVEYDLVSKNYNKKIYETVVENKENNSRDLIQLTLRDVMNKCAGTNFEVFVKRAIMKCVYTGANLDKEIRKIMDLYYEA